MGVRQTQCPIRQFEVHRRAARPLVVYRKVHRVRPWLLGEYLPNEAGPGPRLRRLGSPARVRALEARRPDWQGMRDSLRKARESSPMTAMPRLPLLSASIIPEPRRAPSVGPDKPTPVRQAREAYSQAPSLRSPWVGLVRKVADLGAGDRSAIFNVLGASAGAGTLSPSARARSGSTT